jgi:hypothetical protein
LCAKRGRCGDDVHLLGSISLRGWGDIYSRLEIGDDTMINHSSEFELNGRLQIGQRAYVASGHARLASASQFRRAKVTASFIQEPK